MVLDAQNLEILMLRILVIQTAFPGDAILTLPMLQVLRKMKSDAKIDVLAIPATAEIFQASKSIDEVIVFEKKKHKKNPVKFLKFIKTIRERNYDEIISPHRSARSSLISYFSGASRRSGFNTATLNFLYSDLVFYNKTTHEVHRNLSLIGYTSDWKEILPEFTVTENTNPGAGKILSLLEESREYIALAPGSVWNTKKYPPEYFREIAEYFTGKGYGLILLGGKADKDLCGFLADHLENAVNSAGELTIPESTELLKKCRLLITNDSAPAHMGVAANIPVLTIFCSTVPEFGFYPYHTKGQSAGIVGLKCRPCGIHGHRECPIKTFECGKKLIPSVIIEQAESMLIKL